MSRHLRALTLAVLTTALPASAALAAAPASPEKSQLPFTPGRLTTVIVSPVNPDGSPDYIGAINALASKDVTPENNGFVVWAEVAPTNELGGDSFPPEIRDQILKMAGMTMPRNGPAWQNWESYVWSVTGEKYPSTAKATAISRQIREGNQKLWTETDFPELAKYLSSQAKFLDKAIEAGARPRWWMPLVSKDGRSLTGQQSLYAGAGDVCNALAARALLQLNAGNFEGFLRDVKAIRQLAAHFGSTPTSMRSSAADINRIGNAAILAAVNSGKLSAAQCDAVGKMIDALPLPATFSEVMDQEIRWEKLDTIVLVATGRIKVTASNGFGLEDLYDSVERSSVDWDLALQHANQTFDDLVAAMHMPGMADMKSRSAAIVARETAWKPAPGGLMGISFRKTPEHATREAYTAWVAQGMLATQLGGYGDMEERMRKAAMEDGMLRVLLAAASIRAQSGKWPGTPAELIGGGGIKEMPRDVYSPEARDAVIYKLTEKGPRVYSVGPNGKDEGGEFDRAKKIDDIAVGPGAPVAER